MPSLFYQFARRTIVDLATKRIFARELPDPHVAHNDALHGPALALPDSRTDTGMPVCVQIVDSSRGEDCLFDYTRAPEGRLGRIQAPAP